MTLSSRIGRAIVGWRAIPRYGLPGPGFCPPSPRVLNCRVVGLHRVHYGWIVAFASAGIMATCSLSVYTFGVFVEPLTEYFQWERGPLSLAPSIAFLVARTLAMVTGRLSDNYGPRILATLGGIMMGAGFVLMSGVDTLTETYVFWGLFMGVAFGCFVSPLVSTVPRWFVQKKRCSRQYPGYWLWRGCHRLTPGGPGAAIRPPLARRIPHSGHICLGSHRSSGPARQEEPPAGGAEALWRI